MSLRILQVGANSHGASFAHAHDPVPYLISHGWAATLIEPQPQAAAALRERYGGNSAVAVRAEAVCTTDDAEYTTLWLINTTKTIGSNHSDARCLGDLAAISGTASLSRKQVLQYQRFYRFTPSQCAACSQRLGRPLPPSCMSRVYLDNLENVSVPCVPLRAASEWAADVLVVDAEGHDADVVARYLEVVKATPPRALVYEHAHLRGTIRLQLAHRLSAAGMVRHDTGRHRSTRRGQQPWGWAALRHVLARVDVKDNSVWVLNDTASQALLASA